MLFLRSSLTLKLKKNDLARLFKLLILKKSLKEYLIHDDVVLRFSQ